MAELKQPVVAFEPTGSHGCLNLVARLGAFCCVGQVGSGFGGLGASVQQILHDSSESQPLLRTLRTMKRAGYAWQRWRARQLKPATI